MLRATNVVKGKLLNLWVVFEAIRIHGPIPRTGIAELTGLSKQATSDLVDELFSLGFLREEKSEEKRVGKPPKPITVNPEGASTIGFHINSDRASALVMNLAGEALHRETFTLRDVEAVSVSQVLAETAQRLMVHVVPDRSNFLGIGVATPGPFGVEGISPPRMPNWDGLALQRQLRVDTGLPVSLANDGQCAVTAEWRFGQIAKRLSNFIYVYLGDGLGTGIMMGGSTFGGANGNAGEFGHMIVVPGGHRCICGKKGCLETYVSGDSLLRFLADHGSTIKRLDDLAGHLSADHALVSAWLEEAVEPLRQGLNTLENLFDPETIMLGGDAPGWLIDALLDRVQPLYSSVSGLERALPRLSKSELGSDAVLRGAAVLPLLAMLNPHYQQLGIRREMQ